MRHVPRAVALCLCLSAATAGADTEPDEVTLSVDEARGIAIEAAAAGDAPELVVRLGEALLAANPDDAVVHYLVAEAQGQLGRPGRGRRSAARAYRLSGDDLSRFQSAELAARLAFADSRPTTTQIWLRRAAQYAPSVEIEQRIAEDYARVRRINPFSFYLRTAVRPSDNVNDGADSALQVIDGIPFTGVLSGAALALPGTVFATDFNLGYRLRADDRSQTSAGLRVYIQRVALNDEARDKAPEVSNSDFGYTYLAATLDHAFAVGEAKGVARVGGAVGRLWYGGDPSYDFIELNAGRSWRLGDATALSLDGSVERQFNDFASLFNATEYELVGAVDHELANGDAIGMSLNLQRITSDFENARYDSAALRAVYGFDRKLGPARVTAGLTLGYSDYPDYIAVFEVPGGRQDKSVYGDVNFFFPDIDYAGFAPNLRISTGRKYSNVSRFDTRETSVSVGIESKF
ncbi:hypothetical protein R5H30_16820 [Sulfitobacter sp. D35]|uniref:hypothetical protein n=1 Tax=Sulfitobacter sp. D35 TaxID=3083252 RepID=UPI00296E61A3|nr:hypothetical protein [Sulfitobacter sp. D35]MDW4499659.1 hypothetical protein [Sulfitobacter sp. D35]